MLHILRAMTDKAVTLVLSSFPIHNRSFYFPDFIGRPRLVWAGIFDRPSKRILVATALVRDQEP